MLRVDDIRREFRRLHNLGITCGDRTGTRVIEIIGASFIADEGSIYGTVNRDYVEREIEWYRTQSRSITSFPEPVPAIWQQVAGPSGYVNSNYGWCIWSSQNSSQYQNVVRELRHNPESRRAIMIYTRPEIWNQYTAFGCNDFICTNTVQYLLRDGFLHVVVNMRSNDVVYGYKNDRAWQEHVLDQLCDELGVQAGEIFWNVGSLHIYERHWKLIEE